MQKAISYSRRGFVAGAAAMGACAVLGASEAMAREVVSATTVPQSWDYETDIVVMGGGGGGLVAACKARDLGSEVILLEKASMLGGDTVLSAQAAQGFWDSRVDEGDSIELYLEDMKNSHWATEKGMAGEPLPEEFPLTMAWLENASAMYDFTDGLGADWVDVTTVHEAWYPQPQWDTKTTRQWAPGGGSLIAVLQAAAEEMGVEIMLNTPATDLIVDENGRVVGVYALDADDNRISVKARQAVILASGGFNANRGMMKRYLPQQGSGYCGGCDGNTGDAHAMVQAIGGRLTDMSLGTHWMVYDDASYTTVYNAATMSYGGNSELADAADFPFILVNYDGERFMAETMGYKWVGYYTNNQPYHMNHIVFDSGEVCSAWFDLVTAAVGADNIRVYEADTLEELAAMMQVPADAFAATVERYNGFVDAGADDDFGRMMRNVSRIETAPFRAIRMRPRHYTTYGGIAINAQAQVLDTDGGVIPGLYAAGTCCGAIVEQEGLYYQGGVGQTLTFGYIAAVNATGEEPTA